MASLGYKRLKIKIGFEHGFDFSIFHIYKDFGVWSSGQEGEGEFKKIDNANQLQINYYNNGLKNGTEYTYRGRYFAIEVEPQPKHGKLINTIEYKDGLKNGKEKNYDIENKGELVSEFDWVNDKLHGKVVYYNNGAVGSMWETRYGKKNGKSIYRENNGKLVNIEMYKDDKLDGKCIYYFDDGNTVQMMINYKNDAKDGEFIQYGFNGEIRFHCWYKNNNIIADFLAKPELKNKYGAKYS